MNRLGIGQAWGLRTRLLAAFALLGVATTALVAGGSYWQARRVILQQAQDSAVAALTEQVTKLQTSNLQDAVVVIDDPSMSDNPSFSYIPDGGDESRLPFELPQQLRQAVRDGHVAWQRVSWQHQPYLIIGTQLMLERPDGTRTPSGVEIYTAHSLVDEKQSIARLAAMAWLTGGVSLVFAVALASFAARGVLRPVRELGRAARALGEGDLRTRLPIRGSDELASVAKTFNETGARLEHQVGELRRMETDARRFVADVSHELRTPLAAMTAVSDILSEEAPRLHGDAARAARLVGEETQSLTRLVNDLIEVSRFDSGTAALALDDLDMASAVRATLRTRGWSDRVETDLPDGVVARLDPRRLDVILANLVGNAIRHGAPPVTVMLRVELDWIVLEVGDAGPGLDPRVLPHVFDRFYKADTARLRSEGSGLGLAIARENAMLHHAAGQRGGLVAANRPEGGALFTLRLPLRAAASPAAGGDG